MWNGFDVYTWDALPYRVPFIVLGGVIGLWFHNKHNSYCSQVQMNFVYVCFEFGLMKCFQVKSHCNELLPLPFETIFEMSQSLPLVGQPSVIGHVCMVIIGHNTLATSHLLIYDKHMVYENN